MPFPRRLLTEGEEIVLDLRPHWIALAGPVLWTILIWTAAGLAINKMPDSSVQETLRLIVAGVGLVLWIALALVPGVRWRFTQMVVTNERVITRSGVIAKHTREIPLETINDVAFHQSILERIIHAGDLMIESAGEHGQDAFSNVRRPEHVQLEIYRAAEARKGLGRPGGHSLADELAKLADLKDRGALTDDEFQARKRKLLES